MQVFFLSHMITHLLVEKKEMCFKNRLRVSFPMGIVGVSLQWARYVRVIQIYLVYMTELHGLYD